MLMNERIEQIRKEGSTIIEGVLSPRQRQTIRESLAPWLEGRHFGRNDFEGYRTERVYALLAKSPPVAEIIEHPDVLALVDAFLPPHYRLSAALAINIHPGETPQGWHIDDAGGAFGHPAFDRPREPLGISAIWAIDDFTADNGATELVPGSHRWTASREPAPNEIVKAIMPAGSVLVFAGNLVHRGGGNRSRSARLAITPQYCMPWLRQLENMPLAVPPALAARYSARVQELLGYDVIEPGFMGYVDGRHPKRLLDPGYSGRKLGRGRKHGAAG
jgi:ectoine hydroxylase-related dioxygenase (phytanoyl-CoA dioxygenase family)